MPIYEYEPADHDCLMCNGRVAVIQGVEEPPLGHCPDCGLEIRRVISRAAFKISKGLTVDKAGERGFTTWKKVENGVWEKLSGPGADLIVADKNDLDQIQAEKQAKKPIDLDET